MQLKLKSVLSLVLLCVTVAVAAPGDNNVTFAWNASPSATSPDFAGYKFYYGKVGTTTTNIVVVPTGTTLTVTNMAVASYWASVTAYTTNNLESTFSNILLFSVPAAPANLNIPHP